MQFLPTLIMVTALCPQSTKLNWWGPSLDMGALRSLRERRFGELGAELAIITQRIMTRVSGVWH